MESRYQGLGGQIPQLIVLSADISTSLTICYLYGMVKGSSQYTTRREGA